ncbi:MAG: trypsin-like peptidase domain-containing protein [Nitrososphaerota archaeon]|nr:trypsin-like peptidase domain-containing protein [Nitrososphaerota archaeon]MDG7024832.1 trypsin-like peptidase domain-containing protein [Nitrososphaerota archaeon]
MTGTEGMQLLQSFSVAVTELADRVSPSVVNVNAGRRGGTGLVWSEDGLVVTASHVVGHAPAPAVTLQDGREMKARVLGRDPYADIALLKIDASGLAPVELGSAEGIKVGQFVLALANAFGRRVSATSGIITSLRRSMRGFWGIMIEDAVVSDAKLNPGYSGGPLVDAAGKLLGMNVAYFAGRGVAVSVDSLKEMVGRISRDGGAKKGFLGVVVEPIELPEDVAKSEEAGQDEGLLVRSVEAGSPAKAAGVAVGDVILKLGDYRASDEYALHRALSQGVVGKQLRLLVLRTEKVTELMVTPAEAEQ